MSPQHLTNLFKSLKGEICDFMAKHKAKIEHIVIQGGRGFAPTGGGRNDRVSWGCGPAPLKALSCWNLLPQTSSLPKCAALYRPQLVHLMV